MKSFTIPSALAILLMALLTCSNAVASTNVVILGADLQAAINAASPGDTLVVQSGVYNQNLTIATPVTLVCSGTNGLQLTGNAVVSATGPVSFSQTTFEGTLQEQTNSTVLLSQCSCSNTVTLSGGILQAYDSQFQSLTGAGGKLVLKRCNVAGTLNLTGTSVEALRLTEAGQITVTAGVGSGNRFVLVQSSISTLFLTGCQVYIGYSSIAGLHTFQAADGLFPLIDLVNCNSVLVGNVASIYNTIPTPQSAAVTLDAYSGTVYAYNNRLQVYGTSPYRLNTVYLSGGIIAELANNSLMGGNPDGDIGFEVQNSSGPITLRANLFSQNTPVYEQLTTPAVASCSYCCVESGIISGVAPINCLTVSALANQSYSGSLSPTNAWLSLGSGSPCLNAGPPDAIYNNTDGTRNTIGYTGGPLWNPANYTNNNPMVLWLSTSNQTVLKGLQSTIPVSVAASAGH